MSESTEALEQDTISPSQFRFDVAEVGRFRKTSQGFLEAKGNFSKVGVVSYVLPDGKIRREYRPPEEVFSPESIKSLHLAPVTDGHSGGLLNPKNITFHRKGVISDNIRQDSNCLAGKIQIEAADLIDAVREGKKRALSPGYTCDFDPTPGQVNGEHYDGIQRNIRYNHIAVVQKGRQGPDVAIRLDSEEFAKFTTGVNKGASYNGSRRDAEDSPRRH